MTNLHPCPSCLRHVRASSEACPFCQTALMPAKVVRSGPSGRRLGRYAAFTFQTGLVAAALGCTEDGLVSGTGGQVGSGGVTSAGGTSSTGGQMGSGSTPGSTGGGETGGGSSLGGEGGLGGETGTGGDDPGVPIYSAVPWTGPGRR